MINIDTKYRTGTKRFLAAIIDSIVVAPLTLLDEVVRNEFGSKVGLVAWTFSVTVAIFLYSVIMHYRRGQTLGKMVTRVKVINVDEERSLTIRQAIMRDIVYLFFQAGAILFVFAGVSDSSTSTGELIEKYDNLLFIIGLSWIAIELLTMLTNKKRRAFHDLIAKTVVVRIDTDKQ